MSETCPGHPDMMISPTEAKIDYGLWRQNLFTSLNAVIQTEKTEISMLDGDGEKKDRQQALYRAIDRIARTLHHPELEDLAHELNDEFFALQNVAKKYSVDDPKQVDAEMWPRSVPGIRSIHEMPS